MKLFNIIFGAIYILLVKTEQNAGSMGQREGWDDYILRWCGHERARNTKSQ